MCHCTVRPGGGFDSMWDLKGRLCNIKRELERVRLDNPRIYAAIKPLMDEHIEFMQGAIIHLSNLERGRL